MIFKEQNIRGVFEIAFDPKRDERGYFMRTYDQKIFAERGLVHEWAQENESFSKEKGTVRGLHFQYPPHAEAKLVRMAAGEVFAVFLDLRKDSLTFGKWTSMHLAPAENMAFAPRGIAMGICTLTPNCTLLYKMDNYYAQEHQGAIRWDDPDLKISWPAKTPTHLSDRDKQAMGFKDFVAKHGGLIV